MRANRYVSYLGTEIEPNALSTLNRFESATMKAFERIEAFSDRGSARLGIGAISGLDARSATATATATRALAAARVEAQRTAPAVKAVAVEANAMSTALTRSAQALNVVQGPLGPLSGRLSSLSYIFRDLAGISLAGVLGGGGAFALGSVASQYQAVTDRLRPFYETQQQTNAAMRDVIQIARDTRQALDPVAQLYTRLNQAGKDAGITTGISRMTETVAKAARLSGGDTDTQANGLTQFAQGFGSGSLGGDELKSIRENTFRLAKALADGLGVPIAKLKQLGADGKLTPQIIAQALARSADQIDLEFSRLPKRIGSSLTEAGNNLGVFVGRLDEATHSTQGIAEAISALGNNLPNVITALVGVTTVFAAKSLSAPIDAATASLGRFAATRAAIFSGTATPVTPRIAAAGREMAKKSTARDDALSQAAADRATVEAQRKVLVDLDARAAKIRQIAGLELEADNVARAAAAQQVTRAEVLVQAARDNLTAAQASAAARAQEAISSAVTARNLARADSAGANGRVRRAEATVSGLQQTIANPGEGSRADQRRVIATATRQLTAAEAELATAQNMATGATQRLAAAEAELNTVRASARLVTTEQAAATAALAVAEGELAAATGAATNANTINTTSANQRAAAGIALLSNAEARIAAEGALTVATNAATVSQRAAIVAIEAAAVAQRAYTATLAFGARAVAAFESGVAKMVAFLGGPAVIALTAVTLGFTYLATRTDEAKEAATRFDQAQQELASKLGKTTQELANQSAAARDLRVALAEAGLEKAKLTKQEAAQSFASSLEAAALDMNPFSADARRLGTIAGRLRAGENTGTTFSEVRAIQQRNPRAFENSSVLGFLGANPGDYATKAKGFVQTDVELRDARKSVDQARKDLAKPIKAPPINFDGPAHKSVEQLKAYAADAAEGGTKLAQAREKFRKTEADLNAELKKRRDAGDYSFDDEYVSKLTAARTELNAVGDSQRAAARGAAAHRKEIAAQNKELREAAARAEKLADIQARYTDAPSAVKKGEDDKRAIDEFFVRIKDGTRTVLDSVKVGDKIFTKADAAEVKASIDAGVRKPINDTIRDQERELKISQLILAGRADEADLLREKYRLTDAVGDVQDDELKRIRANQAAQQQVNDAIEARAKLIDLNARAYGSIIGGFQDLIADPSKIGSTLKNLAAQFRQQATERLTLKLFGDPEKKYRDEMTRGLNSSASQLTTSAGALSGSATDMKLAADALTSAASVLAGGTGSTSPAAAAGLVASGGAGAASLSTPTLNVDMGKLMQDTGVTIAGAIAEGTEDIVVEARTREEKPREEKKPRDLSKMSTEDRWNEVGKELAGKVFGPNSILTKAAGKLGTFTSGAGTGLAAQSLLGIGGKGGGAQIGAAIGGGLGKTLLGGTGGLISKGLTSISSSLGQFAGPLGAIAGSVVGSVIGGLFRKAPKSNATVSNGNVSATGSSSSLKKQAAGLGADVSGGVSKIAEALGGKVGNYQVSIGTYDGDYRVSTSGQTGELSFGKKNKNKATLVDFGEDQQGAVKFAILDALKDGAINGIREGAKRLLQAGNDLDAALEKALSFQNVFIELKQYTDPVGAAVDALNLQFTKLIDIFNEAGATSQEFADLQKLYDLKRADAIKQATDGALSNINDFITGLKAGSDSPLSKRTVYDNAKKDVDAYRADLAAGKAVDSDKLLDSLSKLQDASGRINGSRGEFYTDFYDILALAEKQKSNLESASNANGTIPGSPFPAAAQAAMDSTAKNTADIVSTLKDVGASIVGAVQNSSSGAAPTTESGSYGGGGGGAISYLPGRNVQLR